MNIKGFTLDNEEKVGRAILGSMGSEGTLKGGVGEDATEEAKLAEYDRLGGLILKGDNKVKTGSFYDFKKQKPRETPEVVFVFRDIDDNEVEVPEGEAIPMKVKAAEINKSKKGAKKVKKPKKSIEDDEVEVPEGEEDDE